MASESPTTPPTPAGRSERPDFYFLYPMEIGRRFIGCGPSARRDELPSLRTSPVLREGPRCPSEHLVLEHPRVPPERLRVKPARRPRFELDLPEWHAGAAAANREATPHEFQAGSRDDRGHRGELSGQRKPRPSRGPGPRGCPDLLSAPRRPAGRGREGCRNSPRLSGWMATRLGPLAEVGGTKGEPPRVRESEQSDIDGPLPVRHSGAGRYRGRVRRPRARRRDVPRACVR